LVGFVPEWVEVFLVAVPLLHEEIMPGVIDINKTKATKIARRDVIGR
jgi:hypothetical protein